MADDYDDDDFRRSNYERMFGTTPEAEAEAREMEERAAKIKSDEVMQWARQRAEARESNVVRHDNGSVGDIVRRDVPGAGRPLPVVTKAYSAPAASAAARDGLGAVHQTRHPKGIERSLGSHGQGDRTVDRQGSHRAGARATPSCTNVCSISRTRLTIYSKGCASKHATPRSPSASSNTTSCRIGSRGSRAAADR